MVELAFDDDLVEEAVFLWMRAADELEDPRGRTWDAEREALYSQPDPAERERRFLALASNWFARLELGRPLTASLEACPSAARRLGRVHVRRAWQRRAEGSELYRDEPPAPARLVLALRARRFLEPDELRELCLTELLRTADMLDPAFRYRPALPSYLDQDLARRELVRDRFRVLWEARVRGLVDELSPQRREARHPPVAFHRAFGLERGHLGARELYERVRGGRAGLTFDELLRIAQDGVLVTA